ncbi:hypothetical protein CERZMDRAFT_106029 [Cercospora zeae-maydis SCOH1-5]|uniref:Uncharacterized protein n=1 Tax=Cercospora zeae-maydis SCOH1-5 TaxID=717836 RepID=A0A6A6FHK1_9PEZI|nr:hypothetical protein CERZMDRAFT_106029 [Cercospora zeae-maydis SCOH1-5]
MSTASSFPVCRHYVPGLRAPRVCHRCRSPTPPTPYAAPPYAASPYSAAEQLAMERYLQDVRSQQLRDVQALNDQRPSPRTTWRNDRSIADSIVCDARPSSLPLSYPYATTIDDRDLVPTNGAEPAQQGPSNRPQRDLPYDPQRRTPYGSQQDQEQRSTGYVNGVNAPNGGTPRPSQNAQAEPGQRGNTNGQEASATPMLIPSMRQQREASYRQRYRR